MEERKYIINVGTFTANDIEYLDRCLSASYGGSGVESDTIPWGDGENPWDYKALYEEVEETITDEDGNETTETDKHYTGEFVFEPIEIPEEPTPMTAEERINELEACVLELAEIIGG